MNDTDRVRALVDARPWGDVLVSGNAPAAREVAPRIYVSPGTSNAYLLLTDAGRIVINTGLGFEAYAHRRNFDAISDAPTTHIIATQGHVDHVGGVSHFRDEGTRFVAHRDNPACQADDARIAARRQSQSYVWFSGVIEEALSVAERNPDAVVQDAPVPDVLVEDQLSLEVGGRKLELMSTPGGETIDSLIVWLPDERIVFTGNLFGPLFPHFPNFNTIRGDRYRDANRYLESLARVRALNPQTLITGHGDPIVGDDLIRECLDRLEGAVRYVHEETLRGINEGRDIDAIVAELSLPGDLYVGQGYGRIDWAARTFWETYVGWFKLRSTRELYPNASVEAELVALAGEAATLARGRAVLDRDPLRALGLAEAVLSANPEAREASTLARDAHTKLLENELDAKNFWLGGWLRHKEREYAERVDATPTEAAAHGEVEALMRGMPERFVPSAAPGLSAVYQYEIEGAEGGVWAIVVENDACRVQAEAHPSPSCRIGMKDHDFVALNYGELHPLRAAMQGKITFEGDKKAAIHLDKIFTKRSRPKAGGTSRGGRVIRIDDLREPVLTRAQRLIKRGAERARVRFDQDAVLRAAEKRTGLRDFGPMDFTERLELLLEDYRADETLSGLGAQTVFADLVRYASNRLLLQDLWTRHPEIEREKIEAPIIIAGLPRSGTTHLLNLLAADSRFRSLPLWEALEPLPNPREATGRARALAVGVLDRALPSSARDFLGSRRLAPDPRYLRCAAKWAGMRVAVPHLAAMHPMNPDHIHEELELMGADFSSYVFEWTGHVPRYRDHYLGRDQTPHYLYMLRAMKALAWRDPGPKKRWVLKCPQHLEQLGPLLAAFPDATVVFTHRDPVAVIQSTVTMLGYSHRMGRTRVDAEGLLAYWADRVETLLERGVRDRHLAAEARSIDVRFHEFMADPEAQLDAIYAKAGLARTERSRAEQRAFQQAHPRGKEGRLEYDLARGFGADPAALRARYGFYFERFGARPEGA